jgi:hypothetical protein
MSTDNCYDFLSSKYSVCLLGDSLQSHAVASGWAGVLQRTRLCHLNDPQSKSRMQCQSDVWPVKEPLLADSVAELQVKAMFEPTYLLGALSRRIEVLNCDQLHWICSHGLIVSSGTELDAGQVSRDKYLRHALPKSRTVGQLRTN